MMSSNTPRRASTRPWRNEDIKKATLISSADPLLPEEYMEVGQQRLCAISFFMLIQAYKFYELVFGNNSSFVVKYIFIDAAFLWFLPILRIPWMTFPTSVTLVQIGLMSSFNMFLGNNAISLTGILFAAWKGLFDRELSISGTKIKTNELYDSSQHLLGKYTVKILPESTALLNPVKSSFCIGSEHTPVSIPVRLNATEPIFIQLNRVDFNTLEETSLNFTKKDIKKYKIELNEGIDESRLSYVGLPVSTPGLYRLKKVVDSSNLDVRLYAVDVLVTSCPSAYIVGANSKDAYTDRCIGDTDTPKLVVDGVPPLKVKYSRSIKGRESLFSVQSVQPDGFASPLIYGGLPQSGYIWRGKSLSWAASSTVDVAMDTSLTTTGEWMYNIDEVEDAFGNVVNYSEMYNGRDDSKLMFSRSLSYGFMVHPRPQISFKGCDAENSIKLAKGKSADLPLILHGDGNSNGPFKVEFERVPLDDDTDPEIIAREFKQNQNPQLRVSESGIYKLKSIKGKFCNGDVLESAQCLVFIPPEPSITADFKEITDKCAGSVGISADLSLTGTPPFRVAYRVTKDGQIVANSALSIKQSRHQFEYKPDSAGHYAYEFYSLDDGLYQGLPIKGDSFKFEQTIRAVAGASFVDGSPRRRCCSGDSASFDVKLNGIPPFKLEYEITHGNAKKSKHTEKDIQENKFTISTPELKAGGRYTITLVSVEDSNGCRNVLNENDAVVEVRRQRPAAAFLPVDGSMHVKALEGQAVGLPLRLSGEGPWEVTYRFVDPDTEESHDEKVRVNHANGEKLMVNRRGRYSLLDVHDVYCPGEVTDVGTAFEVSWLNKPKMSVASTSVSQTGDNEFTRHAVCEGDEDVFEVNLQGAPPFTIFYDVKGPVSKMGEKIQVATKYANIRMLTSKPGLYRYTFNKIADGIYDLSDMKDSMTPIVVEQNVNSRPSAAFVNKNKVYKACAHANEDDPQLEPIQIQFQGQPPFALTYSVRSESNGKSEPFTIQHINSKQYGLKRIYKGLDIGQHTITLISVQDAQGCTKEMYNHEQTVSVVVSDVPELAYTESKRDFCVGERVSFGLNGIPPFEIVYEFNGKKQKASTNSPFSRLASQPGNLTLLSLTDSASSCSRYLDSSNSITIHDKPSVKVRDDKMLDIHEGDQAELTFQFTGTPPFSFTYTRSEMVGRPPRQKVIESHSVQDVHDYEYSIFTSLQGIYEVIALQDRYCSVTSK